MQSIEVYKFGGVAVGDGDAIRAAIEHVRAATSRLVVVVSATAGTTDRLIEAAHAAARGDRATYRAVARDLATRHTRLVAQLIPKSTKTATALREHINESVEELRSMCDSIAVLKELTPRASDAIVARGERLMARIFADALTTRRIKTAYVDATEVILTERRLGNVWPNLPACEKAAQTKIAPLLRNHRAVIVPGFLGTGPDGELVTLGRGGSDFSAAILARSIHATSVTLWKEVDGLMTADPKRVPEARVLDALHYREAAELAFYGAKVLHPRTMIPIVDRRIPLYVRNTFKPELAGTRIAHDVEAGQYPVKALTAIHGQALISIEGGGMIGVPGVAGRAFTALSQAGHSVSMISQASSESSICFVVPEPEADHAVEALEEAFAVE
ncbi:MAG: aspartate kinase, partial [Thermoanaerobaculia bacterium]